jgi:CRISPR-associated endonuclease/helicase Cas3
MGCFRTQKIDGRVMPYFQFRQAAERYKMIADGQEAVLVPYGEKGRRLIDELWKMPSPPGREFNRRLQRYTVNGFPHTLAKLAEDQVIARCQDRYWVLMNESAYNPHLGLSSTVSGFDPADLVC